MIRNIFFLKIIIIFLLIINDKKSTYLMLTYYLLGNAYLNKNEIYNNYFKYNILKFNFENIIKNKEINAKILIDNNKIILFGESNNFKKILNLKKKLQDKYKLKIINKIIYTKNIKKNLGINMDYFKNNIILFIIFNKLLFNKIKIKYINFIPYNNKVFIIISKKNKSDDKMIKIIKKFKINYYIIKTY